MDTIVKKYVDKKVPQRDFSGEEKNLTSQIKIIEDALRQIHVQNKGIIFSNEEAAVSTKTSELEALKKIYKRFSAYKSISECGFRKIDLSFLRKTKMLKGMDHKLYRGNGVYVSMPYSLKVPCFSCHILSKAITQSNNGERNKTFTFREHFITFRMVGPHVDRVNISDSLWATKNESHPIGDEYKAVLKGKIFKNYLSSIYHTIKENTFSVSLEQKFAGLIPVEVKDKIIVASDIFDEVFLIKEADWKVSIRVENDPLIIGIIDGQAYFVCSFDCTPFEHYAKSEFISD